ncbi:MAG: hypothetical protein ACK553_16925, partial [Planctomycetota bacterium]
PEAGRGGVIDHCPDDDHYLPTLIERKTRTCIAFWTAKYCKHCVGNLSGEESGGDRHLPGIFQASFFDQKCLSQSRRDAESEHSPKWMARERACSFLRVFASPREPWLLRLLLVG